MIRTQKTSPDARKAEFESAVLPHLPSLYSFAIRLTRDSSGAEDLVQEAMMRAFRFFDHFEPGTNARAWLFKILKNTFVNQYHYRSRRPEQMTFSEIEGSAESAVADAEVLLERQNPETEYLNSVLDEEVQAAMDDLPEEFRGVVHLNLVEGFTYQEAADILSIPIGTVMSRLHRGRKILQRRLLRLAQERGFSTARSPEEDNSDKAASAAGSLAG